MQVEVRKHDSTGHHTVINTKRKENKHVDERICNDRIANLYEEDSVATAGALVQFGRGRGTIETGGDKVLVEL